MNDLSNNVPAKNRKKGFLLNRREFGELNVRLEIHVLPVKRSTPQSKFQMPMAIKLSKKKKQSIPSPLLIEQNDWLCKQIVLITS